MVKPGPQHVRKQLKSDPQENLKAIKDSIAFLKTRGLEVIYDCEHFFDGFKDDKEYALTCIKTVAEAGADTVVLCDTNGGSLPDEVLEICQTVRGFVEENKYSITLGMHTHNDGGFGLANALMGYNAGFTHFQGTINGLGERTGNLDLCQLIPVLALKKEANLDVKLKNLKNVSNFVYTLANVKPVNTQPYVGKNAFSHKGGIHVDAVMKGASYEHIDPEAIGNKRDIILSDLSGKANIIEVLKKCNISVDKSDGRVSKMLAEVEKA